VATTSGVIAVGVSVVGSGVMDAVVPSSASCVGSGVLGSVGPHVVTGVWC